MQQSIKIAAMIAIGAVIGAGSLKAVQGWKMARTQAAQTGELFALRATVLENWRGLYALSRLSHASVVMLGDSLTALGPWREMTDCSDIANIGIGWARTDDIHAGDALALAPRAIFLEIGVNDLIQGRSAEETAYGVGKLARELSISGAHVFVNYILPVAKGYGPPRLNEIIAAVNARLAKDITADKIDLRPIVTGADGFLKSELTTDGIHLSAHAYALWRDAIEPEIRRFCVRGD